jgi:cell wall-associated NlpC family hydrolase
MHHSRLAGGLAALAVLLTLILAPAAVATTSSQDPVNARAATIAQRYLGVPYVFGGASPSGFDASGLTMYVFAQLGVKLPHGATAQARLGHRVRLGHLRRGDLVFWGSREYRTMVAIYAGHGRVIEVPHIGAVVSYQPLKGAKTARRLLPVH